MACPGPNGGTKLPEALSLTDKASSYATLSGGMRRRPMVAKPWFITPPVWCWTSPAAGVDVEFRQQLWAYVRKLNAGRRHRP